MYAYFLLPESERLCIDWMEVEDQTINLAVSPKNSDPSCPDCNHGSVRVHSRYTRKPADLPCSGFAVQMHLSIRRFFCDNPFCKRRTFAEQLPSLIASFARRTNRLAEAQRQIAFLVGGEAGSKLAAQLRMATSPDTLLRLVLTTREVSPPCPRVLGVDDWAIRKRHTYGTILVDLEQRKVVDLLPDREPKSLADWLKDHPGVKIISRDRGQEYMEGIAQGAPQAVQVADRFHLLQNLLDVTERILKLCPHDLRQAAPEMPIKKQWPEQSLEVQPPKDELPTTYQQARFDAVKTLQAEGKGRREIARQLGLDRRTVSKYFSLDTPPKRSRQNSSPSKALPYLDYIQKRWEEGCHNLTELQAELQAKGFTGSYASLSRAVHNRLGAGSLRKAPSRQGKAVVFSPRQAAWLLVRPMESLREQQRVFRQALCEKSSVASKACELAQSFRQMVEERQSEKLDEWLKHAEQSQIVEFKRFAESLRTDQAAVKAALIYSWSNGQVEGQVNRLKTIKRQMYGRASFQLLRRRVIGRAV